MNTNTPVQPSLHSGFRISRGVSLSHCLALDFGWAPRDKWLTINDFLYIASQGYDHVRLPVEEKVLWKEDGSKDEDAFATLDRIISHARVAGLKVIVDVSSCKACEDGSIWQTKTGLKSFFSVWERLSAHLKEHATDFLAYELLNEPFAPSHEDWNRVLAECIAMLRQNEPDRTLIVATNKWQMSENVSGLRLPPDEKNVMLSVHFFAPVMLTHHQASWLAGPVSEYKGSISYPGHPVPPQEFAELMKKCPEYLFHYMQSSAEEWSQERILKELAPALAFAKTAGIPLYCGSLGCIRTVDPETRNAYYRDLISVLEYNNIPWANWEYRGDFGIFEWHGPEMPFGTPDVAMLDALFADRRKRQEHA
jgi:endoglucanase